MSLTQARMLFFSSMVRLSNASSVGKTESKREEEPTSSKSLLRRRVDCLGFERALVIPLGLRWALVAPTRRLESVGGSQHLVPEGIGMGTHLSQRLESPLNARRRATISALFPLLGRPKPAHHCCRTVFLWLLGREL